MKNHSKAINLCPVHGIIETIGRKWSLLIVNEIGNNGGLRYNDLLFELEGINPSTLASTLKELQKENIVSRESFKEIPPHVEYTLTKQGKELRRAITPLLKWTIKKGNSKMHCSCSLSKK